MISRKMKYELPLILTLNLNLPPSLPLNLTRSSKKALQKVFWKTLQKSKRTFNFSSSSQLKFERIVQDWSRFDRERESDDEESRRFFGRFAWKILIFRPRHSLYVSVGHHQKPGHWGDPHCVLLSPFGLRYPAYPSKLTRNFFVSKSKT